jgi:hypothetical protein
MKAPMHLNAPDLAALVANARTRGARFIYITDAPPLPPALDPAAPQPDTAPAPARNRKARK